MNQSTTDMNKKEEACPQNLPETTDRFFPAKSRAGILAIQDSRDGRLVCMVFRDREKPEAANHILRICCDALNAENRKYMQGRKS